MRGGADGSGGGGVGATVAHALTRARAQGAAARIAAAGCRRPPVPSEQHIFLRFGAHGTALRSSNAGHTWHSVSVVHVEYMSLNVD